MSPVVAVFMSGFNIGFGIPNVNLSIHYRLWCRCAYLQSCEHKDFFSEERLILASTFTIIEQTGYIFHQSLDQGSETWDPFCGDANLQLWLLQRRKSEKGHRPIVFSIFFTTEGKSSAHIGTAEYCGTYSDPG
jgi:hypothetical protein